MSNDPVPTHGTHARFQDTHWSVVLAARAKDTPQAHAALDQLCRDYWYPIYACIRRQGHDRVAAQDLTQSFFARLLEKQFLRTVDPDKGRFRSFLQACVANFLTKDWRESHALKRGGAITFVPLESEAEERFATDAIGRVAPELVLDRAWALTVMDRAMTRLEQDVAKSGRKEWFAALRPFLIAPPPDGAYEVIASRLGTTAPALRTAVSRLRQDFRDAVRALVAQTVTTPLELEEEMHHLHDILRQ